MKKNEFFNILKIKLNGLPKEDIDERVNFYSEIIEDRIEEGLSEEEAVSKLGTVEEIVSQIMSEIPLSKLVKERIKPKRKLSAWEIILLILGSPLWFSMLIAALSVIITLYAVIWITVITLWAIELSIFLCFIAGISATAVIMLNGNITSGLFMLGASLICAGISIFAFYGCKLSFKGFLVLSKKMFLGIKALIINLEDKK